jgi:dihydroorotase-like cyclic amidohydrolase
MSAAEVEEMGPIDYLVVEWPGRQPTGEAAPYLVDLVDRGLIRVLDLAFITKDEDGSVAGVDISEVGEQVAEMKVFEGASSGLLTDDDTAQAAEALEPGTSAALLVYENAWAGPFAAAVRRSGGRLVANGRIPVQEFLAALDAAEEAEGS